MPEQVDNLVRKNGLFNIAMLELVLDINLQIFSPNNARKWKTKRSNLHKIVLLETHFLKLYLNSYKMTTDLRNEQTWRGLHNVNEFSKSVNLYEGFHLISFYYHALVRLF